MDTRSRPDDIPDRINIDNYKLEQIEPVSVGNGSITVPSNVRGVYEKFGNWIDELYRRTKDTGNEHGFYVDIFGNVIGIYEGTENEIEWPEDALEFRFLMVHSHPAESPIFSTTDMDMFNNSSESSVHCMLSVPEDGRGPGLFCLSRMKRSIANSTYFPTGIELVDQWAEDSIDRLTSSNSVSEGDLPKTIRDDMNKLRNIVPYLERGEIININTRYTSTPIVDNEYTVMYSYTPILRSKID